MRKVCYYVSNSGRLRTNNEDCIQINKKIFSNQKAKKGSCSLKKNNFISVCDGMGGEECGEVASLMAVSKFSQLNPNTITKEQILNTIDNINNDICIEMDKKNIRMGSTLVSAVIRDDYVDIYNLGDSRAYIYNTELIQLSKDHTVEKLNGKKKGALTQHLGIYKNEVELEPFIIDNIELKRNSYLLLCSDGLYDMIETKEIENILSSHMSDRKKRNKLIERAMENGGKDNISFLLVHCK